MNPESEEVDLFDWHGARRLKLLDALDERKTVEEAAEESGIPVQTVYKMLSDLADAGLVEQVDHMRDHCQTALWLRTINSIELTGDHERDRRRDRQDRPAARTDPGDGLPNGGESA